MTFDTPTAAWFWGLALIAGLKVEEGRGGGLFTAEAVTVTPFRLEETSDRPFRGRLGPDYVPTFWLPDVGIPGLAVEATCFDRVRHSRWRKEMSPLLVLWPGAVTRIMLSCGRPLPEVLEQMTLAQGGGDDADRT